MDMDRSSRYYRLPKSIDIRLLGRCNLECPFCFGPRHEIGLGSTADMMRLLPELRRRGADTVVFTGGEPLIAPFLPQLLKKSRSVGLRNVLSTNGTLVARRAGDVLPLLDWIALPLDGPTSSAHDSARPGTVKSFDRVIEACSIVRAQYPGVRMKLGTVITAKNFSTVDQIPRVANNLFGRPDVWKLYQVSYSNYGQDNREALHVADYLFEEVVREAVAEASKFGWETTVYRNSDRSGKYLFVEPDGSAMAIVRGDEVSFGNFFHDLDVVSSLWGSYVDEELLESNVEDTYPR